MNNFEWLKSLKNTKENYIGEMKKLSDGKLQRSNGCKFVYSRKFRWRHICSIWWVIIAISRATVPIAKYF